MPISLVSIRHGRFTLALILAVGVLFPLRTAVGPPLLFALPVLGLLVLVVLRLPLSRQEVVYALLLALVAGISGIGACWVDFSPMIWSGLQVPLVLLSLLAGWSLVSHTGLSKTGVGRSLLLEKGPASALGGFALGILVAMPWACGLVVMGAANEETWVQRWWQPLVAIQPAIAEEAWGRMLLVPLLFLVFRPLAQVRTALMAAVVIMAYWFAYLHTAGGFAAVPATVIIGTLYILPISFLWLWRGLETAIGFHFWLDFVKFVVAYLLNHGIFLK